MRRSVTYEQAYQAAFRKGYEEGFAKGQLEGARKHLLLMGEQKFDPAGTIHCTRPGMRRKGLGERA